MLKKANKTANSVQPKPKLHLSSGFHKYGIPMLSIAIIISAIFVAHYFGEFKSLDDKIAKASNTEKSVLQQANIVKSARLESEKQQKLKAEQEAVSTITPTPAAAKITAARPTANSYSSKTTPTPSPASSVCGNATNVAYMHLNLSYNYKQLKSGEPTQVTFTTPDGGMLGDVRLTAFNGTSVSPVNMTVYSSSATITVIIPFSTGPSMDGGQPASVAITAHCGNNGYASSVGV